MKLSIVIPVYNTETYLPACIDSVLDPACSDYEIILVNDGSTDGSEAVCKKYCSRYPSRIRSITTENGGLGAARNVGLGLAQGEFVLFLDSDDTLSPGAVSEILAELTSDRDMVICDFVSVDPDGNVLEIMPGCKRCGAVSLRDYPGLLLELPSGCNKICRRSLFLDSGIRFPGRVWYEDLRTMPKLYLRTDRIWACSKSWYRYLTRPGSITRSASLERNLEIVDAMDDLIGFYKEKGSYSDYAAELEYLAFYHIFLVGSVRVCRGDPGSTVLPRLREAFLSRFPDYESNPYYAELSGKHRLLTKLLLGGHYRAVAALMRFSDRLKGH